MPAGLSQTTTTFQDPPNDTAAARVRLLVDTDEADRFKRTPTSVSAQANGGREDCLNQGVDQTLDPEPIGIVIH